MQSLQVFLSKVQFLAKNPEKKYSIQLIGENIFGWSNPRPIESPGKRSKLPDASCTKTKDSISVIFDDSNIPRKVANRTVVLTTRGIGRPSVLGEALSAGVVSDSNRLFRPNPILVAVAFHALGTRIEL
jgi:hypothetical protein